MKKILGLFVLLAIAALTGCADRSADQKSMEQLHRENGVPVRVETLTVKPMMVEAVYHAVLTGIEESTASAMIADRVEGIAFRVGQAVARDDVVLTFPSDNPAAQYTQTQVAFEHAQTTLERMTGLYESGGISLQDLDQVRTQFRVAEANWEAVRQSIQVKAPISGVITRMNVQPSENVHPGDPLFTVSNTEKLKAKVWMPESKAMLMRSGTRATASWNHQILEGKVMGADRSMHSGRQAFGATLVFDNPDQRVLSGVNAEVRIYQSDASGTIVTERKNVQRDGGGYFVFIADHNVAYRRPVRLGRTQGLDVEIAEGLTSGDVLIIEGQMMLSDGDSIQIIE